MTDDIGEQVSIRLPIEARRFLVKHAKKHDMTVSQIIRKLVRDMMEEK